MTKRASAPAALNTQEIETIFSAASFAKCETDILQPADPFLELSGEDIRRRTYVFMDPYGKELCLRPDMTIPTCLAYLADRASGGAAVQRLSYNGFAFRCQKPGSSRPNEFPQLGIEFIGSPDEAAADAEVFNVTLSACKSAGLEKFGVRMGDLGLFAALINGLDMPEQWRTRIKRSFWRPKDFTHLLDHLSSERSANPGLLRMLSQLGQKEAEAAIEDLLDLKGVEPIGGRTVSEITERLRNKAFDQQAPALPDDTVSLIHDYLTIAGTPEEALKRIRNVASDHSLDLGPALSNLEKRFELIEGGNLEGAELTFATEFGRDFEYYTGFVFEVTHSNLAADTQVAGGGRYDNLLCQLGAEQSTPAAGAMIRADRLKLAAERVGGGRDQ
jgi:ATP phosphoribosyltransferase regulatory subunit